MLHFLQYTWLFPVLQKRQFRFFLQSQDKWWTQLYRMSLTSTSTNFFHFRIGSWFIWLPFWWSPSNSDKTPSCFKPFSSSNSKLRKSRLWFFRLSELDKMTSVEIPGLTVETSTKWKRILIYQLFVMIFVQY